MAISRFTVEAMIRGYHEYTESEEELSCEREIVNAHDTHAYAVRNITDGDIKTVGHVISALCSIFIRRSGSVNPV